MYATNLFIAVVLFVGANARHVRLAEIRSGFHEFYRRPERFDEHFEYQYPGYLASARIRRQAQGSLTVNSDGTTELVAKVPLLGNDRNVLSAIGSVGLDNKMNMALKGFGLALDNVNGHGVSAMKETIPGFGSKLTGAGHATLFNNDVHNVGANAFVSKNMPKFPNVPNFNTVEGGVDYTYKNTIGASLGITHSIPGPQRLPSDG